MNLYTILADLVLKIDTPNVIVDQDASRHTKLDTLLELARNIYAFSQVQNISHRVLICLPRSMEYLAAMIGLNMGGIAFAPLTDAEPPARLDFIKKDLGIENNTCTVIDRKFIEDAKAYAEQYPQEIEAKSKETIACITEKDINNECIFVYTSGSTGLPKGILYDNKSVVQCINRSINILKLNEQSVVASNASFSFVALLFDVLSPLCAGSCVHITPDHARKDPAKLAEYLNINACTHAFISPQILSNMLQYPVPSLKTVTTGSEKVSNIFSQDYEILNIYGMSEASVPVIMFHIDKAYENTPIGKACDGMFVYILDENNNEVADGEEGEICIAGGISKGYFNLPELQEKIFTKNPYASSEDNAILLRTGDMAKKLPDGNIQYVNRKDWMVKINGQRVELGDIESVLKALPEIQEVVIKDFISQAGQTYLCAYYTLQNIGNMPPSETTIREHIARNLPPYMQPRFCVHLDALPVNANGKLDRKALTPPDIAQYQTIFEEPVGEVENALCQSFEAIFKLARVGRNDDFFTLGGDSIQAVLLATKASAISKTVISVGDIYMGKTPQGIALEQAMHKQSFCQVTPNIDANNAPLTFAEKLIVTEQMIDKNATTYNINPVLMVQGKIDIPLLEKCLCLLVQRYAIYNASYVIEKGEIVRKIQNDRPVCLEKFSCSKKSFEHEIAKRNTPYNLEKDPLYRFTLFTIVPQEYALLAGFHHTIGDATSFAIFFNELSILYSHNADINILPVIDTDYFAYAHWQEQNIESFVEKNQVFIDMFKDGIPQNAMPCHALRPSQIPFTEECVCHNIDKENTAKIHGIARELGVTMYTLFMAVTALTVGRYTSSEDVVLGTGMSGRDAHSANIVGMFSKELPVRTKPCKNMTFIQYIHELNATLDSIKKNQTCSLEAIIAALEPERDPSRRLFYDVSVNYLHQMPVRKLGDASMSLSTFVGQKMPVDIAFEIARTVEDSMQISLNYSSHLYEEKIVANMLELFTTILDRLVSGERGTLGELMRLPERQEQELLHDFCGKKSTQNADENVVSLFKKQAQKQPNALAVVSGDISLTYGELDSITDKLAKYLISRGAKEGKAVAILVNRNPFMTISALAVLKTGAAYVPLDPAYPAARLHFMLQDTGAFLTIVDDSIQDILNAPSTQEQGNVNTKEVFTGEILLTSAIENLPSPENQSIFPELNPNAAMVFLYTSGTTGIPKGVMWSHAGLTSFCTWYTKFFKLSAQDKVTAYAGFSFDANAKETWPALTIGACIYIIPEEMRLNLPVLQKYYNENGITLSFMTTQVGRQFATLRGFTSLRTLTMGGEGLAPFEPTGDIDVYNLYGPTEGTCVVSGFHYDKYYDRPPVGKPTDNTDFYVLDDNLQLVPAGVEGELYIGGHQVAIGYHNRPDVTEKAFLPNPFSHHPDHGCMYKTGDAVRWLGDGNVEVLGRRDSQVKIRGFRVELGEIENRIRSFEAIANAVVIATNAPGGGKCAVAYAIAKNPDYTIDVQALNAFIIEKLPEYMVPASTIQVDNIPLTPNGKVDTRKLPEPVFTDEASEAEDDSCQNRPLSRLQNECSSIVASVLGHTTFSVSTNLLRAGLASLNAIMVMTKISNRYGVSLSVNDFLANPTILQLENLLVDALLESAVGQGNDTNVENTSQNSEQKRESQQLSQTGQVLWPLSENQMGVYYECAKNPESILYNIPFYIDLDVKQDDAANVIANIIPDVGRLRDAVSALVHAHPILKTRFVDEDGTLWQCQDYPDLDVNSISCHDDELEEISSNFVRPFALVNEPLCRICLVNSESTVRLLFDAHHCIFDGVSANVFLEELRRAYEGEVLEKEGLSAVALAQKEKDNPKAQEAKAYVAELLKDYQGVCELPADLVHDNQTGELGECVAPVATTVVNNFCQQHGVTPAALFLAASSYTLYRFLSLDTLYLATISNGRDDTRLAQSIGMFVRTLPLALAMPTKTDIQSQESILDFIQSTQKNLRVAIKYEDYPFTRIAQDYGFEPAIMYACELGIMPTQMLAGQEISLQSLAATKPKFKLSIHVEDRDGAYVYALQYDTARYSHERIQQLTDYMAVALNAMLADPQAPLAQLSLVDAAQGELLRAFGQVSVEGEPELVTAVFERTVQEHGDKCALVACDQTLSFNELNDRANRLAHALLKRGVKIEDKIAFMLNRTSHVLIAMLGIMKAGCAFIPIDPTYPKDRVEHVLHDSNAPYLLINSASSVDDAGDSCAENTWDNALEINDLLAEDHATHNPCTALKPDNLAYSIYTSGSTGKPKGVLLTHAGISNYVMPHPKNVQIYALKHYAHTMLSITTVAFDMFLKEAFGALMNGVTLVFADEESTRDPMHLTALFEKTKANAFSATPSRMLDFMENDSLREAILSCDVLMCGGEKYSARLLEHLKTSRAHVFNSYGPTEITVSSNAKELISPCKQVQSLPKHITVGAPLYNAREYIVDKDNNILPIGVTGELLVGGRGVGRGYNNLEAETAKSFITFRGERVYRTGDLAMWTADGEVLILGRNDGQIKLRGLRIELGEIEKALHTLPEVKSCAVIVRTIDKTEHLCAFCVADTKLDFAEVRAELAKTLTHYMVPTAYAQLDTMPRTPNGKLDTKALPLPTIGQAGDYVAPANELEAALCEVFNEILQLEKVGAEDNFFENGGTSLAVTRLLGLAHKKGIRGDRGQGISYSNVFACPSPRQLAQALNPSAYKEIAKNAAKDVKKAHSVVANTLSPSGSADCSTGAEGSFVEGYDFTAIHKALQENNLDAMRATPLRPVGNTLFTGASGFLGITLLHQFLKNEQGKAYCLLRKGKFSSVEQRLTTLLFFYFEDSFQELMGSRIIPIEGDVTDTAWFDHMDWLPEGETLDTVFNCAANVRHFAHDDSIARVNVGGAKHCIELCKKTSARLIHVSTVSIGGFSVDGTPPASHKLKEQGLYFNQEMENQYVQSKFLAEYHVLSASVATQHPIDAKIMRVGNLMGHSLSGEFQINAKSNSFAGRLRALSILGCAPYIMADQPVDLSPVDSVAQAILLLSQTAPQCRIYHPVNNHRYLLGDLIDNMRTMGIDVTWTEQEDFTKAFDRMREDMSEESQGKMEDMVSLVAYQGMTEGDSVVPIKADYHYTVQTLKRLQWQWPLLGREYQKNFLQYLEGIGHFD